MVNEVTGGKYKFAAKENYEDYSSGRVLYGAPGATGFPVRLISEIFQRGLAILKDAGVKAPYTIYDPFCGAGYSLTVIGLLHGEVIKNITASDISKEVLITAAKNLSLLTSKGFKDRVKELSHLRDTYNKLSHKEALESTKRLKKKVSNLEFKLFQFNMLGKERLPLPPTSQDFILSDLPYGKLTHWQGNTDNIDPIHSFLNKIRSILKPKGVVAVSVDKKQKISYDGYKRIGVLKLGKRQVVFLVKQ